MRSEGSRLLSMSSEHHKPRTIGQFNGRDSMVVKAGPHKHLLTDNSLTFGGVHWNNPFQIYAELRYRFRY